MLGGLRIHPLWLRKKMIGLGSMYAIAEMNQRAEEMALRVRSELFRIGCLPEEIRVERRGPFLVLTCRNQTIHVDPFEVLILLRKTPTGLDSARVWAQIYKKAHQTQKQKTPLSGWAIVSIVSVIVFSVLLLITLVI
jgi:hypothetical protein